jgi:hypothetical protein
LLSPKKIRNMSSKPSFHREVFLVPKRQQEKETIVMDRSSDPEEDSSRRGRVILLKELLDLAPRADILDFQLVILTVLAGLITLSGVSS